LAALVAGTSRALNAAFFPMLIPISQLIIAGLIFVEGAILTYGAYIGEVYAIERVHYVLIGGIGLGALIGAVTLIASTFSLKKEISQPAFGKQISRSAEPKIWQFVEQIAEILGSKAPDNVIVGLEPTFYATAAPVRLLNEEKELNGETMYLSLPLMRLFSTEELRAVIGHELGHFSGADTAYSLKFAPVYAGLSRSIDALASDDEGVSSIAKLPAVAMLSLMLELFARNERTIGQKRELLADKAGVSVSSAETLSVALAKVAIYAPIWSKIRNDNVDRLNAGKVSGNLSHIYQDSAKYDVSHTGIAAVKEAILATKITHPTDTHPTIFERLKNIGFDADGLTVEKLIAAGNSSNELLESVGEIEEELTLYEHRLMVALGHVTLPDEKDDAQSNSLLNAVYTLAATMVGADGKIDQAVITSAESVGMAMFSDFDSVEFRACCNDVDNLPAFNDIVAILDKPLTYEHKSSIYDYLKKIAMADGELAEKEKELLVYLRKEWSLEV
jgi:Zn-dependent protease with chaperone function